jgi:predicted transcriptional regulator
VAQRKKAQRSVEKGEEAVGDVSSRTAVQRIANLLGLLIVRGQTQGQQAATLSAVGFSPNEIATLLHVKANAVRAAISDYRKGKAARRNRKASLE